MMIGQGWSLGLWVLANRRILVIRFSEMPNSLAANLEAIQARKPTMRQYSPFSHTFAGLEVEYQGVFFLYYQLLMGDWRPDCSRHSDVVPLDNVDTLNAG